MIKTDVNVMKINLRVMEWSGCKWSIRLDQLQTAVN